MKKVLVPLIVSMLLISLVFVKVQPFVDANPTYPRPMGPLISFSSPENKSYNTNSLVLNVSVGTITNSYCPEEMYTVTYSLDGQEYTPLPVVYKGIFDNNFLPYSLYFGAINLPLLTDGTHSIRVACFLQVELQAVYDENMVFFTVDKVPPHILILTVKNETYKTHARALPLNFTVNEETSLLTYSLDGQDNVTVAGNTTLEGLTMGVHHLIMYAQDKAGNVGASKTIFFNVKAPDSFPVVPVIVSIVIVVIVSAGLLFYFKKRKQ